MAAVTISLKKRHSESWRTFVLRNVNLTNQGEQSLSRFDALVADGYGERNAALALLWPFLDITGHINYMLLES